MSQMPTRILNVTRPEHSHSARSLFSRGSAYTHCEKKLIHGPGLLCIEPAVRIERLDVFAEDGGIAVNEPA